MEWLTQRLKFFFEPPHPHAKKNTPLGENISPGNFLGNFDGVPHWQDEDAGAQENMFCTACYIIEDRQGFKVPLQPGYQETVQLLRLDSARSAKAGG